jgi:predicted CXXCH cytochrome family protein
MKRYGILFTTGVSLMLAGATAVAAPVSVVNSKHNLSSSGPGTIKSALPGSGGTTQVCVFCHTPHTSSAVAPLWNKTNPSGPYSVYASDVMSYLSITPEQPEAGIPHVKTRICMSCHDGTIALGNLVNLPSGMSSPVQMTGTSDGRMPSTAAGYIGTDIRDDHPVAVKHSPGTGLSQDPELVTISGSPLRLYNASGDRTQADGDYVECTSCHDAHDNQYGDFLLQSNQFSGVCITCHDKTGYFSTLPNESAHANASELYSPPTNAGDPGNPQALGTTVGNVRCMDCHFPHKAGVAIDLPNNPNPGSGRYLLTFQEEQSCFNTTNRWGQTGITACHGDVSGTAKDIETQMNKSSGHHAGNYSGLHRATEGRTGTNWTAQSGNGWHIECHDCHNPHTAGRSNHSSGTNAVSATSALYGAGGVEPSWPAAWNSPSTFTYMEPLGATTNPTATTVTAEYQTCLRCHSTFAWNTPPSSFTDQGKEFNVNNASYHSVVRINPASYGTTSWTGGSGFSNSSLMYCSDCHGNNAASPMGPHGSTNAYLLKRGFIDFYTSKGTDQPTNDICFLCHDVTAYQTGTAASAGTGFRTTGGVNLHTQHRILASSSDESTYGYVCVNCHAKIPHGYRNKALIVLGTDGPDVTTYAAVGGAKITSAALPAALNYGPAKTADCSTVNGCHQ